MTASSNNIDITKLTPKEYIAMREDEPERLGLPPKSKSKSKFKDSGSRTEFGTGAVRDAQAGKGRMDLLPPRALFALAQVFEEGARKYSSRNWEKGIPLSRFFDSGMRHAYKYLRGDRDEPHDAMACWNFMCLVETRMRIEEGLLPESLNDLPFNPLDIKSNPLGIQESTEDGGLVQLVDIVMEEIGNEPE